MISVVMATHNGAATLALTLDAFNALGLSAAEVEILAVDNASSDGTRDILEQYRDVLPLTVLAEPRRGKSFALNWALDAARGEFIVFADDDILPEPQWLDAYCQAAARLPGVDLFAGQVRHHWQKPPPGWLQRLADEGRSYAGTPPDQPEGPVPAIFFKGLNFMCRRKVIERVRFSERPAMNFSGTTTSAGGEDTAFVLEAVARGHCAHYVPAACVRHIVRPAQVGIRPVLQRYLRIGRSMTLNQPNQFDPKGAKFLGYPRYLFRTMPRDVLRALRHWIAGDSYAAANDLIGVAMTCGRAQQWREEQIAASRARTVTGMEDRA
jgi:glucosyl-dolichyl phosphate glucuronosyltransferase